VRSRASSGRLLFRSHGLRCPKDSRGSTGDHMPAMPTMKKVLIGVVLLGSATPGAF
jgi:hypothetical protein